MHKARRLFSAGVIAAGFASPAFAVGSTQSPSEARVFELTLLKSIDRDPSDLARFIRLNWFEMDRIAVEQGVMSDYRMLTSSEADEPWNVVVIVGYFDAAGYAAISTRFEAIRRKHQTVAVAGKTLSGLGRIVASRRLVPC